jgi:hypothetical protein
MIEIITIKPSTRKGKKYMVILSNGKTIHFGAKGYEDYTTHQDPKRKERYIARHKHMGFDDPNTPRFWSRYLLWEDPSMDTALKKIEKKLRNYK